MGSVITYDLKCPKCEQEKGYSDYYYKTGEEYFYCQECDYNYVIEFKRNVLGDLVTVDGTDKHTFDNLIMVETIRQKDSIITQKEHIK